MHIAGGSGAFPQQAWRTAGGRTLTARIAGKGGRGSEGGRGSHKKTFNEETNFYLGIQVSKHVRNIFDYKEPGEKDI